MAHNVGASVKFVITRIGIRVWAVYSKVFDPSVVASLSDV